MHPQEIKIIVIVPAYNEGPIFRDVIQKLSELNYYAIIVVDDGSKKNLKDVIADQRVYYLRHRVNLGQGAALQTGFIYARKLKADIVITFDADGQHRVEDCSALILPILQKEADVVLGSRFIDGSSSKVSFSRTFLINIARFLNFLLYGFFLTDAHNGLRALNKRAVEKITFRENRMAHASEILAEIKRHRLKYKEVPVHIEYSDYSRQKGQSGWDSIKIFIDLVLQKLFR